MLQDRGVTGVFGRFAISPIRRDVRQTHPTGCQHGTDRSKSQMVTRTPGRPDRRHLRCLYPFCRLYFFVFLARHALLKVVIGQFVIGGLTVASGLDAKILFKSNVKVFWLYEHKHSTREREREEISLLVALLCTCMESESRTSEESSFYLKGFFFSTRDPVWVKFFCLSLLYVSIWLCYAIVLCSVWSWPTQGNFISIYDQVGQIDRLYMSIDSSSSYIIHNVLFFSPSFSIDQYILNE